MVWRDQRGVHFFCQSERDADVLHLVSHQRFRAEARETLVTPFSRDILTMGYTDSAAENAAVRDHVDTTAARSAVADTYSPLAKVSVDTPAKPNVISPDGQLISQTCSAMMARRTLRVRTLMVMARRTTPMVVALLMATLPSHLQPTRTAPRLQNPIQMRRQTASRWRNKKHKLRLPLTLQPTFNHRENSKEALETAIFLRPWLQWQIARKVSRRFAI